MSLPAANIQPPAPPLPARNLGPGARFDARQLADLRQRIGLLLRDVACLCVVAPALEVKCGAGLAVEDVADAWVECTSAAAELRIASPARPVLDPVESPPRAPLAAAVARASAAIDGCAQLVAHFDPLRDWPFRRTFECRVLPALQRSHSALVEAGRHIASDIAQAVARMGARDRRHTVFNHTRDYRAASGNCESGARAELVAQLRTQRDELDAVETFARVLAADASLDSDALQALASIVADEARHTLLGHEALVAVGHDPYEIPIGTIGAELRAGMDPWLGFAQICLIGETGNIAHIDRAARLARELGHDAVADALQTIHRDERRHLRIGRALLKAHYRPSSLADVASQALAATNAFLAQRSIPPVTLADAARLLGE